MSEAVMIKKRSGEEVLFNINKIVEALYNAGKETGEFNRFESDKMAETVWNRVIDKEGLTVENVQDEAERVLIDYGYIDTAKAYIIYRELRARDRAPNIFNRRVNLKPYEYPELVEYKEAIQHSYWLHTEFNYTSDIQDFKVNISESERNVIKNAMLAISQVEVAVKTFWGDLYHRMPKAEVGSVGATFAESEVRHSDAYSHLLEILGLNGEFEKIGDIPALSERVKYLSDSVAYAKTGEDKDYALSVLLFSLFIEHVSLFSQFLIIMSFNKHRNLFKGISNVIEATSKEEQIHGLFGIELINIIKKENPEWFDVDMESVIYKACYDAYESEKKVVDWIYEQGELSFLPKDVVLTFIKDRLNNSLSSIGYSKLFEIDTELLEQTDWFDDEIIATKQTDFFHKRSINYTKGARSITSDDLF